MPAHFQITFADFDGDKLADLAGWNVDTGRWFVFKNLGGRLAERAMMVSPREAAVPSIAWEVIFADINGDGRADLINRSRTSGLLGVHYNLGNTFSRFDDLTLKELSPPGPGWKTLFGDFDRDGYDDLVNINLLDGRVGVHRNTHAGFSHFDTWTFPTGGGRPIAVPNATQTGWRSAVADFDGDGYADFANLELRTGRLGIHAGNGHEWSQFDSFQLLGPRETSNIEYFFVDVTGDGAADIVAHDIRTGDIFGYESQRRGETERGLSPLLALRARTAPRAQPYRDETVLQAHNQTLDAIMFYVMDWMPSVYAAQPPCAKGPAGPENGWWPLNPNYPLEPAPPDPPGTAPGGWDSCAGTPRYRTNTPLLGTYASNDPHAIRQHAYWLASAGITSIAIDWTNFGDPNYGMPFMTGQESSARTLLRTYKAIDSFVPPKVFIVMRNFRGDNRFADHWWSMASNTAGRIHSLAREARSEWFTYDDQTNVRDNPLLWIFTSPADLRTLGPDKVWRPDLPFNFRWGNGGLVDAGLTKCSTTRFWTVEWVAQSCSTAKPFWSIWENRPNPAVTFSRLGPDGEPEFTALKVTSVIGQVPSPYPPGPRPKWIGVYDQHNGITLFDQQINEASHRRPRIAFINAFNYPMAWNFIPGEGLSLNASLMTEPGYPLPAVPPFPGQPGEALPKEDVASGRSYPIARDSSFHSLDRITVGMHRLRGLKMRPPGSPICGTCDHGSVSISSSDFPTRVRISASCNTTDAFYWINVDWFDSKTRQLKVPVPPELRGAASVCVQTKNAFGTSLWSTCSCH